MDIRLLTPSRPPTNATRSDALLGAPRSAWDGGARGRRARRPHRAVGGARSAPSAAPAAAGAAGAAAARRLDQRGRAQLRLRAPGRAAGRGLGGGDVLRAAGHVAAPRRVVHVCDDIACRVPRRRTVRSSARPASRARGRTRGHGESGVDALAVPGAVRPGAGRARHQAGAAPHERLLGRVTAESVRRLVNGGVPRPRRGHLDRAAAGDPALRLLRRVRRGRSHEPRRLPRGGRLRGARAPSPWAPRRVIAEVTALEAASAAAAPRSPPAASGTRCAKQPAPPHYLVCNADESEPGTFKDRVLLCGRPVRDRRGHDDRRVRDRVHEGLRCTCAPSTRSRIARLQHAIDAGARAPACWARTSSARGFAFDIEIRRGVGRLHLRRGDRALRVHRGLPRRAAQQAAVPGRARPLRQADGGQQRRDAGQHAADRPRGRRGVRADRHRGSRPARASSA